MDQRMKLKNPKTWLRKWLKIDKQVQQNLLNLIKICFWCSRVEVYGRDLPPRCYIAPPMQAEKEVKQVLNVTNIQPNKRKKVFKGAMERNPGVEEKEKKARCL